MTQTIEEFSQLFQRYFNSGDIDSLVGLYEPEAVLLPEPGKPVKGTAAIRAALEGFFATGMKIALKTHAYYETGDLGLMRSTWSLSDGKGGPTVMEAHTSEVIRRQPDGTWRYIIDDPYGGAPNG